MEAHYVFICFMLQEVIDLLSSFREIMHKNWEKLDVDKIQERWFAILLIHAY